MQSKNISVIYLLVLSTILLQAKSTKLNHVANVVQEHSQDFENITTTSLFNIHPKTGGLRGMNNANTNDFIEGATYLDVKHDNRRRLAAQPAHYMVLEIPQSDSESIKLNLYKTKVYSQDANVIIASNGSTKTPEQGQHYWGVVQGDIEHSLAAISISDYEISGIVQMGATQYVLGKMDNSEQEIFYPSDKLNAFPNFTLDELEAPNGAKIPTFESFKAFGAESDDLCMKLYVEAESDMYRHHGSIEETQAWIEAAWSQVFILYKNEGIDMTIKTLKIWDIEDPYTSTDTVGKLYKFQEENYGNFDGDLAHLMGYEGRGGVAWLNVLCNKHYGFGYSGVSKSFNNVPTYSWTVMVLAHEVGHNLGAHHSHACVWGPNGDKAVDCCAPHANSGYDECWNGCNADPYLPTNGGTVMSYCHMNAGINLNEGFGEWPGNRIRSRIAGAECLKERACDNCPENFFRDADGDGYGNADDKLVVQDCSAPDGYVEDDTDCDDNDATVHAWEIYYEDSDGDGFGNKDIQQRVCGSGPQDGYVKDDRDCNDGDRSINPGAQEVCNEIDDDCNRQVDDVDESMLTTVYRDEDGDAYGNPDKCEKLCFILDGWVENAEDCNDEDAKVNPGASEVCNGKDDNCSGTVDDVPADQMRTVYQDADRDGYGNPDISKEECISGSNNDGELKRIDLKQLGATVEAEFNFESINGKQSPSNLIDDGEQKWNKWQQRESTNSWVVIEIPQEVEFSAVGFKSANKAKYDPEAVDLSYWDSSQDSWIDVDSFALDFEDQRWHTLQFDVPKITANKLRFNFTNPDKPRMILGEIILYSAMDNANEDQNDNTESSDDFTRIDLEELGATVKAEYSVNGGGTRREYPENLIKDGEEPWNKWYQVSSKTSWVEITIPTEVEFGAIAFKSANDVPRRDPEIADLQIWNESEGKWNGLGTFDLTFESKRWNTLYFDIPRSKTNKVKVTFTNTDFRQIQLGEILLLKDPADEFDWVLNSDDCDDTDPTLYWGAACQNEDGCTGIVNSSCICVIKDSDDDGVCNTFDQCPDEDDTIDSNKDGIPDCTQDHVCTYENREFTVDSLKSTSDANSTEMIFDPPIHYPQFTVFSIDADEGVYSDLCTIIYTDKDGNVSEPMVMTPDQLQVANNDEAECYGQENWRVKIDVADITKISISIENAVEATEGMEIGESKILLDTIEVCV